ncbi:MAG: hypothetical protein WD066_14680 [Planctomycetaceae bacterium]
MSRLNVYWPDAAEREDVPYGPDGEPLILSFCRAIVASRRGESNPALLRARSLHRNRCCPECDHPVVQPLELADAFVGRGRIPVPGTATLVGFRCGRCAAEWRP